jgi:hypothetical protein
MVLRRISRLIELGARRNTAAMCRRLSPWWVICMMQARSSAQSWW